MKLKHLKIGYRKYKLIFKSKKYLCNKFEIDYLKGLCNEETGEIYVAKDVDNVYKLEILLHEIQHAINFHNTMNLHTTYDEEIVTMANGNVWTQVFVDNPKLIKLIKKLSKGV